MSADRHIARDQRRLTVASMVAFLHPNNKEIPVITITRRQARQIRAVFRRALGISSRSAIPPLHVHAGPDGLSIRCRSSMAAVEFYEAGELAEAHLVLPFEALADFEGGRAELVSLEQEGDQIIARWNNGQVPQVGRYDVPDDDAAEFSAVPATLADNEPRLLAALRSASDTADREAIRYALNCMQLRGGEGRIAATDGSQLLVQGGFEFPWEGDRLVPRSTVFASREFAGTEQVSIGATDDWLTFRVGPWTLWFAVEREAGFPHVDDFLRNPANAPSTLRLTNADADFAQQTLQQLPSDDSLTHPITIDLDGEVAIRARAAESEIPTELVLSNSTVCGEPLRFNTNRRFLARALQLGFREVALFGSEAPVICRDAQRDYVWMVLEPKDAIAAHSDAVQIVSTADPTNSPPPAPERNNATMTKSSTRRKAHTGSNGNGNSQQPAAGEESPLEQAEALQQTLQQALSQTRALTASLRKRKKQSQLMKSTLASLRQLQTVDV